MAYDFLKKLYGEAKDGEQPVSMTYEQLERAINKAKLQLADLSAGGYVPQQKFDAQNTELESVRAQLAEANTAIISYKDMDIDGIKKAAADWEAKYQADTQALQDKLNAQARSHAEDMFMSGYQFTSKAARNGILSELRAKDFKLENGQLLGAKDFVDGLMANDDYKGAFVQPEAPKEKPPMFTMGGSGNTKPSKERMTLEEAMAAKNADPNFVIPDFVFNRK